MRNLLILLAILTTTVTYSRGYLVPKADKYGPLQIKSHRVEAIIKNGAAKTVIKETFHNRYNYDLEGIFVFPLPKGANVSLFRMKMSGKWVSGKVLEKNKARNIYNRIVRQMKDPGLIEYVGNEMFKASVYPIPKNGDMEIEITYTQTTNLTGNIYSYTYPLKASSKTALETKEDFTFTAKIESDIPIKSVYSPSHKLDIIKKEKKVTLGFEKNKAILNKDIEIYYTVDQKKIGASILAFKPEAEKNGYFMLMISPRSEVDKKEVENKNLLLVVDASGSMTGDKMKYAKKSLKYIVNRLNEGDKFNIIRFSSGVDYYKSTPVLATDKNMKEALKYIDNLEATGGTAIDEALKQALKQADDKLPNMIVFMTDGRPTVGETEISKIVNNSVKNNTKNVKIFSFGIGHDLNAILVDKISDKNNGTSEFIKPGSEIEAVISSFYDKVAFPVLTDIKLKINGVKTYDLYPYKMEDLFKGEEIRIFARYKLNNVKESGSDWLQEMIASYNKGKLATLTLTGNKKGKKEVYEFNINFKSFDNNDFIPNIWATKKVGFLLEEIRLNGEKKELVDEVKALATKFAIVTPYTSYLVTEPTKKSKLVDIAGNGKNTIGSILGGTGSAKGEGRRPGRGDGLLGGGKKSNAKNLIKGDSRGYFGAVYEDKSEKEVAPKLDAIALKAESGKDAVKASKSLKKMKRSDRAKNNTYGKKTIGNKTFILRNGIWVDNYMDGKRAKPIMVKLKYMSDLYLKLLSKNSKLRKYLSVGKNVTLFYGRYKIEIRENHSGKEILPKGLK